MLREFPRLGVVSLSFRRSLPHFVTDKMILFDLMLS
jgi:hypothetical protein